MDGVRLHVVTGKGGIGKTTVASALALALSRQGKRVLLARSRVARASARPSTCRRSASRRPASSRHAGGGEVWGISVDAKAALLEYLQMFYKLGRAGGALERLGVIDFATTIAPGVRDVLLIGKVYEAVSRTTGTRRHQGPRTWDAVVLDAPPTGRIARFLNVNVQVADLAKVGPIHSQAESITRMLRDRQTVVHVVTLLEEMPVQETLDAIGELSDAGFGLGTVVVNQVREPLLDEAAARDRGRRAGRVRGPGARRPRRRGGARRREDRERPARRGARPRRAGRARALRSPTRSPRRGCPRSRCPCSRAASRTAASRCSPTSCSARGCSDAARPGSTARSSRAAPAARTAPDASTSTPSSPTPTPGSSSAAASGGVGKTTTAAALGVRAAEAGRRVVVLTIDPARRLAQSLGLTELDNTPRPVTGIDTTAGGSLHAMMLDMKRTFDEVVEAHSTPDKAAQILANPFYQAVSSSFAGTQEYMAMEKLGQLRARGRARGHLGPHRRRHPAVALGARLPRRPQAARLASSTAASSGCSPHRPRRAAAPTSRCSRSGRTITAATMTKVLGGQMLADVQTFVAALDTMFGGFRERADVTYALLKEPATAFLVVAAPERDALREASYFVDRLEERGDAARRPRRQPDADAVRTGPERQPGGRGRRAARGPSARTRPTTTSPASPPRCCACTPTSRRWPPGTTGTCAGSSPATPGCRSSTVPASATDIHDLEGLRTVGAALAAG